MHGNKEECWDIVYPKKNFTSIDQMTSLQKYRCAWYFSGVRNYAWNLLSSEYFAKPNGIISNKSGHGYRVYYNEDGTINRIEPGYEMIMKRFHFVNNITGNSTNGTGKVDWLGSIVGSSVVTWHQNDRRYF